MNRKFKVSEQNSRRKLAYCLLTLLLVFPSCEKITNIRYVDSPSTGKLSYKVVDDGGKGIPKVKVSVYLNDRFSDLTLLDDRSIVDSLRTDADGVAIFSDLTPGNYKVVTDSPVVNRVKYNSREIVQVVADREKKKTTRVSDFYGTLKINIISQVNYVTPLKDIQVFATSMPLDPAAANIQAILDAAPIHGITDENGGIKLKIPSNITYYLTTYNPKTKARSSWNQGKAIQKNEELILHYYSY